MGVAFHSEWPDQPDWDWLLASKYVDACLVWPEMSVEDVAKTASGLLCYLATPYSKQVLDARGNWDQSESEFKAVLALHWSAVLAQAGVTAISPILNSALMTHSRVCG